MATLATSTESSGLEGANRAKSTRLDSWMVRSSCIGSWARTGKDGVRTVSDLVESLHIEEEAAFVELANLDTFSFS